MNSVTKKIYNTSPRSLLNALRHRLHRVFPKNNPKKINHQILNESSNGCSHIFDESYFARRDPLIQFLLEEVRNGKDFESVIGAIPANQYDERIVEYPYFAKWLLSNPTGLNILDIGCVMNNKLVSGLIKRQCSSVWFCNIAVENTNFIQNPTYYHISDIVNAFPNNEQFPLVTCFSTIEHIGYDNSQYGNMTSAIYSKPNREPLIKALLKIIKVTESKGKFCLSVPYGFEETKVHPLTNKIAFQVFGYNALFNALSVLKENNIDAQLTVYGINNNKWIKMDPIKCESRYGDGYPAAGAVAFIEGKKL